jgi:hypothetical protein
MFPRRPCKLVPRRLLLGSTSVFVSVHLLTDLGDAFGTLGIGQDSFETGAAAVFQIHDGFPFP